MTITQDPAKGRDRILLALLSTLTVSTLALSLAVSVAVTTLTVTTLTPEVLLLGDSGGNHRHSGEVSKVQGVQELLGVGINLNGLGVDRGHVGHPVVTALALLLLQLEGDTADGSLLNTPHQVSGEAGNLVAEALRGDQRNLIANPLVGLEVEGEAGVVLLNDDAGSLLDGLSPDTTLLNEKNSINLSSPNCCMHLPIQGVISQIQNCRGRARLMKN